MTEEHIIDNIKEEKNPVIQTPDLKTRIQSTFIDSLSIILLMFLFSRIFESMDTVPDYYRICAFIFIWVIFEPLCTSLGCTPGNFISKIRVRNYHNTTKKINFFQAVIRYTLKCLLGVISFFTIHSNSEKRAIHDLASGSIVIYK